jgi:outer membrane biosynthesis protein TonB
MSTLLFPVQKPFRVRALLLCSVALILVLSPTHPDSALAQASARMARKVLTQVSPEYPDFFRNGHFEGRIVAEATVLPNGSVSNVEVKAGNPMFATFASKALMKWKYAPGPDKTVEEVIFNFNSTPR